MLGLGVDLENVTVQFGSTVAVRNLTISIHAGEFFSFLGPSGCGKSSLLRTISGFCDPDEGHVRIGGQDMTDLGPHQRPTAMIFQNLALFPLMRVHENVAFPLEVRGMSRSLRRSRAEELLDLVALPGLGDRYVHELSGGQKQRVAIARALAAEPKVLLLDEPLSALDLKLRQRMRGELRDIQKSLGLTFIYITHDQGEAMTMSDRVAIMHNGSIEQFGTARDIYTAPKSPFVASFVGESNIIKGMIKSIEGNILRITTRIGLLTVLRPSAAQSTFCVDLPVVLFIRPESLHPVDLTEDCPNRFEARVLREEFEGHVMYYSLQDCLGLSWRMSGQFDSYHSFNIEDFITVGFDPEQAIIFPDESHIYEN